MDEEALTKTILRICYQLDNMFVSDIEKEKLLKELKVLVEARNNLLKILPR